MIAHQWIFLTYLENALAIMFLKSTSVMRKQCIRKRRIIIPRIISTVFDIIIHKFSQLLRDS